MLNKKRTKRCLHLHDAQKTGTLLVEKRGAWCCPGCGRRLITRDAKTQARELPVFCPRCHRDWYVNIDSGLCYLSLRPISPSGE